MVRHTLKILQHLHLVAFDHFRTLCTKGLKVKKMSVPKMEGKSLLFDIVNEFPNMISVTSEVGYYVKVSQLRNLYCQKQQPEVFCEKRLRPTISLKKASRLELY